LNASEQILLLLSREAKELEAVDFLPLESFDYVRGEDLSICSRTWCDAEVPSLAAFVMAWNLAFHERMDGRYSLLSVDACSFPSRFVAAIDGWGPGAVEDDWRNVVVFWSR
jgi:hypothetical protein